VQICSLNLRDQYGLGIFQYRVLKGIFGPKRNQVVGGWRHLHKEELHNSNSSSSKSIMFKSSRMSFAGHVAWMGRKARRKETRKVGRPRRRWVIKTKLNLR
jgi:hypothetical protein